MPARSVAAVAAALLIAAACSDAAAPPSSTSTSSTTSPPSITSTTSTTTSRPPPTTTVPPTTTTSLAGVAGSDGVGDPYLPGLGNGGYDAEHYVVELDVDPVDNVIAGTATVTSAATENLASFNLDFSGLTIDAVAVDGIPAAFTRSGAELTITPASVLAAGEDFVASITYSGTPQPQRLPGLPLVLGWQGGNGATFVVSEPNGAQNWYPVNDHPSDKATYTFRITVPEGFTVAANGVLATRSEGAGGTTYVWEMAQPMASYLATVVVARLTEHVEEGPDGLTLRSYFPAAVGNGPELFARTGEMLEFVADLIGPYPFDAYGVVVAGEFAAALETQTLSVFGGLVTDVPQAVVDRVAIHELAHQWFGNSVTPTTWRDVWLNEGFATLFEWLWIERVEGPAEYQATVAAVHAQAEEFAIGAPADPGVATLFGGAVYLRGGLVLAALRAQVGDDVFFEILRTYYQRFAYGNVATTDFVAVASEVGGADLGAFLAPWLDDAGVPPLPAPAG